MEEYKFEDLIKEVAYTDVVIKLAYLLDLFPKLRSEFEKSLKLTELNKNSLLNVMTMVNRHKVIKVEG